jgi:hypothetical protein
MGPPVRLLAVQCSWYRHQKLIGVHRQFGKGVSQFFNHRTVNMATPDYGTIDNDRPNRRDRLRILGAT